MTQQETRQEVFQLSRIILDKQCYIKGYGEQFRVVDATHTPVRNISEQLMRVLQLNNVVTRDGLLHVVNPEFKPFTHAIDVKLPNRNE